MNKKSVIWFSLLTILCSFEFLISLKIFNDNKTLKNQIIEIEKKNHDLEMSTRRNSNRLEDVEDKVNELESNIDDLESREIKITYSN